MGDYTSVMGVPPERFQFAGREAKVMVPENSAQNAIDYFKQWLPVATQNLKFALEQKMQREKAKRLQELWEERAAEERRLKINRNLRI